MIVYNVTIKVNEQIATEWLDWIQQEHILDVMDSGCFTSAKLLRLLEIDDEEGPTYAVQYFAESKSDYNRYMELHAERMRQKSFDKWGNQFIAFRSVMQTVQ